MAETHVTCNATRRSKTGQILSCRRTAPRACSGQGKERHCGFAFCEHHLKRTDTTNGASYFCQECQESEQCRKDCEPCENVCLALLLMGVAGLIFAVLAAILHHSTNVGKL